MTRLFVALALAVFGTTAAIAGEMKMAVTTSFNNSGLADVLLPAIEEDTGIELQLLPVGTGQAIRLGEAGDVDAILVHSRPAEEAFVKSGFGTHRREIMYNDFVILGPDGDTADVREAKTARQALMAIAGKQAPFVSRGDDSGTHKKEMALWKAAGLAPQGEWYRPVGASMGGALNIASGMNTYILADRASWLNFGNKGDLALLFEGDEVLHNQYAYIPVNPEAHPEVKSDLAAKLEGWFVSDRARELIDSYAINGEQLFTFNAEPLE